MAETNEERRRRLGISDEAYREGDIIKERSDGSYTMEADPNFEYDDDKRERMRGEGSGGGGSSSGGNRGQSSPFDNAFAQQNQLLQQMWESQQKRDAENAARAAEEKARRDALFGQWQTRAQQSLNVTPEDPAVRGQVENYRAEQERMLRNSLSDAAESKDGLGDTRRRMAAERVGQNVGSFQSELMSRELSSRRAEIADALSSMGGLLDANQQAGLQRELANLDNAIKQYQLGISDRDLDLRSGLGFGDLGLRRELGMGGLNNDLMRIMLQNQQFYGDLGLRGRTQDDYYDLVRRGRLGNPLG